MHLNRYLRDDISKLVFKIGRQTKRNRHSAPYWWGGQMWRMSLLLKPWLFQ